MFRNTKNYIKKKLDKKPINHLEFNNLKGQEILNTEVNANQIRLNTSGLPTGLYIINIKSNNTSVKRKLLIE